MDFDSFIMKQNNVDVIRHYTMTEFNKIGEGSQGVVYKISPEYCVKVYKEKQERKKKREEEALLKVQGSPFFPKVYRTGANFIIMEYIPGLTLRAYLKKEKALPRTITKQLIAMFQEIEHCGINNRDVSLNNIMIADDGTVKRIDLVAGMRIRHKPEKFFIRLQKAGFLDTFLKQVKEIDKKRYEHWKKLMPEYFI